MLRVEDGGEGGGGNEWGWGGVLGSRVNTLCPSYVRCRSESVINKFEYFSFFLPTDWLETFLGVTWQD